MSPSPARDTLIALSDARRVRVRIYGTGPDTIWLIPSAPYPVRVLVDGLGAALVSGTTLVAMDARGRGDSESEPDNRRLRLQRDADDIEDVRQALRIGRFAMLTHGFGAATAAYYASQHPGHLTRIALLTPGPWDRPRIADLARVGTPAPLVERFYRDGRAGLANRDPAAYCTAHWGWYSSPIVVADTSSIEGLASSVCWLPPERQRAMEEMQASLLQSLDTVDVRRLLATATLPSLVLVPAAGGPFLVLGKEWHEALPQSRIETVPGYAVFPWVGTEDSTFRLLRAFLVTSESRDRSNRSAASADSSRPH